MQLRMQIPEVTVALILLIVSLGLAGCGGGEEPTPVPTVAPAPTATLTPTETPAQDTIEPTSAIAPSGENNPVQSPLAAPNSPLSAPPSPLTPPSLAPTPVTSADGGGLIGRITVAKSTGDIAVAALMIGLAEVIRGEDGVPKASGYEASMAPKATTDDYGRFVFNDLKPGLYTLILDAVVTQYQLDTVDTGETILVEIKPNEIVDIGELRYPSLPIPGFQ